MKETREVREQARTRAKYLTASRPANDTGSSLVVLKLDELLDAIRAAVSEALGQAEPASALLTKQRLAERLGVSMWMVEELQRRGMPSLRVGDSPRFIYETVLAWLAEQKSKETA